MSLITVRTAACIAAMEILNWHSTANSLEVAC